MSAQLLWVSGSGVNRCQCGNATIVKHKHKHKHIRTQGERGELEQANIASGLRWLGRTWWKDILSDRFAIELHRKLSATSGGGPAGCDRLGQRSALNPFSYAY